MLEYLIFLGLGITIGVFTGLTPGIHPNTVVFSTLPFYFAYNIDLLVYMSIVAGMNVSHTFLDFLPAIFLSAPEAEAALSSLPGAQMAARGQGLEAFDYTVAGGVFSIVTLLVAAPFLLLFLEPLYKTMEGFMGYLLMFFLFFLVLRSENSTAAFTVAALSGVLGVISLSSNVNQQFVLIPVFSGLFALPSVFNGIDTDFDLPEQYLEPEVEFEQSMRGGVVGFMAGMVAGVFPGLGAAVSTSFLSPLISSRKEFLAGMGGVNTSDIIMSFIALYLIGKSRSGASVALKSISEIGVHEVVFLAGLSLVAVSVSSVLAIQVSRHFSSIVNRLDMKKILYSVSLLLLAVTFQLTGFRGILVLLTSGCIGYAALLSGERAACMAVLLVPAILFYSGGIFM